MFSRVLMKGMLLETSAGRLGLGGGAGFLAEKVEALAYPVGG